MFFWFSLITQPSLKDTDLTKLIQPFYAQFIMSTDNDELLDLTLAANYLDISPLQDLCSAWSFSLNNTKLENNKCLNNMCDFTAEKEVQVQKTLPVIFFVTFSI